MCCWLHMQVLHHVDSKMDDLIVNKGGSKWIADFCGMRSNVFMILETLVTKWKINIIKYYYWVFIPIENHVCKHIILLRDGYCLLTHQLKNETFCATINAGGHGILDQYMVIEIHRVYAVFSLPFTCLVFMPHKLFLWC